MEEEKIVNSDEIVYKLPRFQSTFIDDEEPVVAIVAAKGSGKTFIGARFALKCIAEMPREQGLIMFNTLQQCRDVFRQEFKPVLEDLGWDYHFNEQQMVLKVFGDTIVHFRSAEPDAVKKIESIVYGWGWADEASYYPIDSLKTFTSRIRKGKALIRITSMPDEPDAFFYTFIETLVEQLGGELFEMSLADNPDRVFADRYEKYLRSMYFGAELERFLSGKRVSLSGEGAFIVNHNALEPVLYNKNDDIYLVWDFNAEFRAVSCWKMLGKHPDSKHPIIGCYASFKMSEDTVNDDAEWLCEHLKGHKGYIYLHGDASGDNRSAQTTESMWVTVRRIFRKYFSEKVRYIVPSRNPNVKDTIHCANWAFSNGLVLFDPSEKFTYASMSQVKLDKFGDLDKSIDYQNKTQTRTHHADTGRYMLYHVYRLLYRGGKGNRIFVV